MFQVRQGVFETNSSSTHSLTVCSQSDYDNWANGKVYLNEGWWTSAAAEANPAKNKKFITKDEAISLTLDDDWYKPYKNIDDMDDDELDDWLKDNDIFTIDNYFDDEELESYFENYTSEHGDDIVVFGQYGYR